MNISLRTRLTLIYGGLFLLAGMVLIAATYALFTQQLGRLGPTVIGLNPPSGNYQTFAVTPDGVLTGAEARQWMTEQRDAIRSAATKSLLIQGAIALSVVAAAAAGLGWLIAGRVLSPLHRVTDTARRIATAPAADRGLRERIGLHGPRDDVKDLADAFDTMVERLDRSFDGQRRFVANASHELRTPLTLGRSLIEVAMHRGSASNDVQQLGHNLLRINSRHEQLITGLLLLARSDNELTERFPVDLADIVAHVIALSTEDAQRAGVTLHDNAGQADTTGDALLLERLVHNLVDNGIRHNTGPGGWVRVDCRTRAGHAEIQVSNTGPVLTPQEIPALFEPFHRRDNRLATANGAGLGLSIVRSIAHAHGGAVIALPRESGGLQVTVTLPANRLLP